MLAYPIRPIVEADLAGFLAVDRHASHSAPMSQRAHANFLARLEFDRTFGAFDGGTIVGGAGAFSFRMRVPGAMAAVAGVTLVPHDLLTGRHAGSPTSQRQIRNARAGRGALH